MARAIFSLSISAWYACSCSGSRLTSAGFRKPLVIATASAIPNTDAIAPPASAALMIAANTPRADASTIKYQANTLTTQDVTATSPIMASARRLAIVIASPVSRRWMSTRFFGPYRLHRAMLQRRLVAYPTSVCDPTPFIP
jgi:hypothetical protein